ncbi:MAG: hypothetical protein DI565_02145 [Ancylobacter novellus]|uniref:DUF2946 domain-containing protein n=1 Tax=Ancylobacter novellus TaxID=921 RepID=A0A2W5KQ78_ANCNO|nr:MAG: hypothetical protein DI565_02145 [Ancylobacter novellus]
MLQTARRLIVFAAAYLLIFQAAATGVAAMDMRAGHLPGAFGVLCASSHDGGAATEPQNAFLCCGAGCLVGAAAVLAAPVLFAAAPYGQVYRISAPVAAAAPPAGARRFQPARGPPPLA